ncbi:MAG: DUF3368 domain-containing protein [Halobacteriales archaeon]|nr:DUF3368 domain-containing protein [Halobacteriales archaeon]
MRRVFVDASAFITLAAIGRGDLLHDLEGRVEIPATVQAEIIDEPAASTLANAVDRKPVWIRTSSDPPREAVSTAAAQLGEETPEGSPPGDVALLAHGLEAEDPVIVTDDKPLRKTCKALGIPVSGAIGVLIAAVERGDLEADEAKEALVAMDKVGARLSASLLRRAERLIDEAAGSDRS